MQTVSFLTYLLKSYAEYIRPHEESICKSIVNLLVTCSDSASIRKVKNRFVPVSSVCFHLVTQSFARNYRYVFWSMKRRNY